MTSDPRWCCLRSEQPPRSSPAAWPTHGGDAARRVFPTEPTGHFDPAAGWIPIAVGLMLAPHPVDLSPQRRPNDGRKNGDPILRSLATTDPDLTPVEVEVLDPERQALHQTKPATIQDQADQSRHAVKSGQDLAHFGRRQDDRNPGGQPRPRKGPEVSGRPAEDLAVEKNEPGDGLVKGTGRYLALDREMGEKFPDLRLAHVARVSELVELDVSPNPVGVGGLSTGTIVPKAEIGPRELQEFRFRLHWLGVEEGRSSLSETAPMG